MAIKQAKQPLTLLENPLDIVMNPSKRKLHVKMLHQVIWRLENQVFPNRKLNVLCMPGISGWDIEFFKRREHVGKIVAVEENEEVYLALKERYPDLEIHNTQTSEYLRHTNLKFDIIFLDYFATFSSVVKFDVATVYKRKLINDSGYLLINIYGARDPVHEFYNNVDLANEILEYHNLPLVAIDDSERIRCLAFNSLIFSLCREHGYGFGCPGWRKYKSNSAYMYTACMTFKGEVSYRQIKRLRAHTPRNDWFVQFKIPETTSVIAMPMDGMLDSMFERKKAMVVSFYKKNNRIPFTSEIVQLRRGIKSYPELVRSIGLCPIKNQNREDILGEVDRIIKREGKVNWELLNHAHISKFTASKAFGNCKNFYTELSKKGVVIDYHTTLKQKKEEKCNLIFQDIQNGVALSKACDKHKLSHSLYYDWVKKNKLPGYSRFKRKRS